MKILLSKDKLKVSFPKLDLSFVYLEIASIAISKHRNA